jgi:hypothetical protein
MGYLMSMISASEGSDMIHECLVVSYGSSELVGLPFGFLFGHAILAHQFTYEVFLSTLDLVPLIVGEIIPFFFKLALELMPVAFYLIPVHADSPFLRA